MAWPRSRMQEEWIDVSTKMIISEARKWVVTYRISDFAGTASSYYSFMKRHCETQGNCKVFHKMWDQQWLWWCWGHVVFARSQKFRLTVTIMCVKAVVIVGDCVTSRNFGFKHVEIFFLLNLSSTILKHPKV